MHYTQYRINVISIVAEVALYLPVPIFGFLCDRYGPRPIAVFAGLVFGVGYFVAAFTYKSGPPPDTGAGEGWPFVSMVLAFVCIGFGTCALYIAGVTTCAKNYGRGKHKGFALSAPIAAFGLSGMWQSQVGSRLLSERNPDGSRGDLDVFRYFLFLGGLLLGAGIIGSLLFRVVDENELIDEAVEELQRSGILSTSEFYRPGGYGTMRDGSSPRPSTVVDEEERKRQEEEDARKKAWLLWSETKRFLMDHTMWWLAAAFFLVTGPGEAFINNLGTIIGTLYPAPRHHFDSTLGEHAARSLPSTSPATHVSIVAITSTLGRIASGTLSDLLAPVASRHQHRRSPESLTSSLASLDPLAPSIQEDPSIRRVSVSRVPLVILATLLSSAGFILLASGAVQNHAASRFWLVSALVGTGYGATFSLVPIIISCVWGVENFGTNWGIVAVVPAFSTAVWSVVYAAAYEKGSEHSTNAADSDLDGRCFGTQCYAVTFWAEAVAVWVACLLFLWAWRGKGGWRSRGIAV